MVDKIDIISTKGACRVGLEPLVDAMNMKGMAAFGQFSDPLAVDDLLEASRRKQGFPVGRFSRTVKGEDHQEAMAMMK